MYDYAWSARTVSIVFDFRMGSKYTHRHLDSKLDMKVNFYMQGLLLLIKLVHQNFENKSEIIIMSFQVHEAEAISAAQTEKTLPQIQQLCWVLHLALSESLQGCHTLRE